MLDYANQLGNQRLRGWTQAELNGYESRDALPQYRVVGIQAKGLLLGPFQAELRDQGLASGILDEKHRWWATTAYLMEGIAAYERITREADEGSVRIPWPADLVAAYQRSFMQGWALNRAWQEIPTPALTALVDTVRNRLLEFALELRGEIGESEIPRERVAPDAVDNAVTAIIYGGNNVIANEISGSVKQISSLAVSQSDFTSLGCVLNEIGISEDQVEELKEAIASDVRAGEEKGFGPRTSEWIGKALVTVGRGGGKIAGDVAKATLTKAILAYFGLQ